MRIRRSGEVARGGIHQRAGKDSVPRSRQRRQHLPEPLEPRRMLHHAGHEDDLPEIGIYATYIKADDYVDTEYEAELAAGLAAASPLTSIPVLHSLPGAAVSIYLDFDGHYEAVWGAYTNVSTPVFDIDGDATTFSATELTRITNIWKRVAEDFAPFQVDVTTENPGDFSNGNALLVSIGGGGGWLGSPAGGVAYIGNFTNGVANTVYVFPDALSRSEKSIAEAASHEVGHAFGLRHQSLFDANGIKLQEYNPGGGGWAPIMGVSYYNELSTWYDGTSSLGSTTFQDDLSVISSPTNGFGYRPDDHADDLGSGTPLLITPTNNTVSGSGIIGYMTDVDAFSFSTDAGPITLSANVPALGPNLNAVLELRDSNGNLVAAANPSNSLSASISLAVPAGDYTLLVKSTGEYGRIGSYTITGTINAGLFAMAHTPAEGAVVTTLPTDFQIDFSEAVDTSVASGGLLQVNGIPADSVTVLDNKSIVFHYLASPVSNQGLQQMTMAGASFVTLADGSDLHPFVGSFRYDALPLAVTSTAPLNGSIATLPLISLQVNFNEPFDPSSIGVGDLVLDTGSVTGVTIDDEDTVTFTIAGVESEANVHYSLPAGAITDEFGNPLVAYSGTLAMDIGTTPFPTPLAPVAALGSGIHESSLAAAIGFAGDVDDFTIDLPAGAKLSIVVDPAATLRPSIELLGPGNVPVANQVAGGNGLEAVVQTAAISAAGPYIVRVSGNGGSTGAYSLKLVLNSAVEQESHDGASNSTPATAQNIESGFVDLGGGIEQAGILGVTDPDSGVLPQEYESNDLPATANLASHNFVAAAAGQYQIGLKGTISSANEVDWFRIGTMQIGDVLTISMSGTASSRGTLADPAFDLYRGTAISPVQVTTNDDSGPGTDALIYRFTVTTNDTYYIRARAHSTGTGTYQVGVNLENTGTAPTTGGSVVNETEPNGSLATATNASGSWRAVQYVSATNGAITGGDVDHFAYEFKAGDVISVLADATSGTLDTRVALLNSAGTVIASDDGSSVGLNADSPLYAFVIPTTGTYYVRTGATAGTGDYTTTVLLSSTTAPTAPAPRGDYYAISLEAGETITAGVQALAAGSTTVAITNAAGTILAQGATVGSNFDQAVTKFVAPTTGVYYVKVDGGFSVPYSAVVTRGGTFDTEVSDDPNSSHANVNNVAGVVGNLNANIPTHYGQFTLNLDSQLTAVSLAAAFAEAPLEEQAPGSMTAHYSGTIVVNRQPTFTQFPTGSNASAIPQPGPFLPNSSPADYAGKLVISEELAAYGKFTGVKFDLSSALLGPLSAGLSGDEPNLGNFPANSVIFTFTSGTFDYDVPGLLTGTQSLAGLSETNQFDGPATLQEVDGVLRLTLPVFIETTMIEPSTQLPFAIRLEGQVVASLEMPGPIDPIDWYEVDLQAGEKLTLGTETLWDNSSLVPSNTLDPFVQVWNASGDVVASDDNSAPDGKNANLTFVAPAAGTYRIAVHAQSGEGDYVLRTSIGAADPAPTVVNVAVRGADGAHPSYDIPTGSGDQLKTVPVGRIDQVSITFSSDVSIDANDLTLTGQGDRPPYTFSNFEYTPGTRTATWTLTGPIDTDTLLVALNADGPSPITNLAGLALDGEWTNPASLSSPSSSAYPSGNGAAGGDFLFEMWVAPGDATQDHIVDIADYTVWADHFLQAGAGGTNGDFNTDGVVDIADYTMWADRFAPVAPLASAVPVDAGQEVAADVPTDLAGLAIAVDPLTGANGRNSQPAWRDTVVAAGADIVAWSEPVKPSITSARTNAAAGIATRVASVVDQWMRDFAAQGASQTTVVEDAFEELSRGWGRPWRKWRS